MDNDSKIISIPEHNEEISSILEKLNNNQLKDIIINKLSNEEILDKYKKDIKGI
jgi:hypothetical protein